MLLPMLAGSFFSTRGKFPYISTLLWCLLGPRLLTDMQGVKSYYLLFKLSPTFSNFCTEPKLPKFRNSPVSQKKKIVEASSPIEHCFCFAYGESMTEPRELNWIHCHVLWRSHSGFAHHLPKSLTMTFFSLLYSIKRAIGSMSFFSCLVPVHVYEV